VDHTRELSGVNMNISQSEPLTILPSVTPSLIGDYTLRALDFDTMLVGPITDSIIDADRLVRSEWSSGFPNFAMYRAALAGDSLYIPRLRVWCVAFAVAYCESGGVRRDAYSDELACIAGWDALHLLLYSREMAPYSVLAEDIGVHKKTYKRIRDAVYKCLRESVLEYWARLGAAYRHVKIYERKCRSEESYGILKVRGSLFHGDESELGNGCFIRDRAVDSDDL
jgi:hypothetical protein